MAPLATSSYLGWLILLFVLYPFALVGIRIFAYEPVLSRATLWFNVISGLLAIYLLCMHLQVEVVFGRELLDAWFSNHPDEIKPY